jgi:endo-1,4-beta-xylanase
MQRRELLHWAGGAFLGSAASAQPQPSVSLNAIAQNNQRSFGFAIAPSYASKEPVKTLLSQHAGVITAENAMKWRNIQGVLGTADYSQADRVVEIAESLKAKIRGHTLGWHQSTPAYLSYASADTFIAAQTAHAQALVKRYAGRIHTWDVLNEVIEPDHKRSDGMRESVLSKLWGVDQYPKFFELARVADPLAKLAYNDYGMEQDEAFNERRRTVMLRTLENWVQRKTPIDVLGLQAHLDVSRKFSATKLTRFLDDVRAMGLSVQITELDVRDIQAQGSVADRDASIAALYKDFMDTCLSHSAVEMVVLWNVTDDDSWVNRWTQAQRRADGQAMRPTLFDTQGHTKPAFDAVVNSLRTAQAKFSMKETQRV